MTDSIKKDEKTGSKYIEDFRKLELLYKESLGVFDKYFQGLEEGKVYASMCRKCGSKVYPPRFVCPVCGSKEVEWFVIDKRGKLITYAEMNVKPVTHAHYDDYILGIGEFDGVKVLGIVEAKYEELSVDMEIEWDIKIREPENYPVIVFKPSKK